MPRSASPPISRSCAAARDPRAYVHQASELGIPAIGIADHNTLAGVVRAYKELDNPEVTHKPKLLIGARIVFIDGTPDILVYPRDRAAYGRLCQLLTRGKRGDDITRIEKGECHLRFDDLLEFAEGQLLVLTLPHRFDAAKAQKILAATEEQPRRWRLACRKPALSRRRQAPAGAAASLALAAKVPLLATNEVLYHHPARRPLQDVLTCIREKTTIDAVGRRLEANAERYLKPAARNGAAVSRSARGDRGNHALCRPHRVFARPAQIPVSGRAGAAGQDRAAASGRPDLGRRRQIFRRRDRRHAARHLAQGTRADRRAQIRALFPHRARHRPLCAQPEHPVPGPGIGGEFGRLLRARHHLGRSDQGRSAVRALHLQGAAGAARHRRRFRAFAARGGDAICLSPLWPPPRRDHRHRHPLSAAQRDPRRRQGAGADRGRHRGARRYGVGKLGQGPQRDAGPAGRARSRRMRWSSSRSSSPPS